MKLKVYDKSNINKIPIIDFDDAKYALEYLMPFVKDGVNQYIDNIYGEMKILVVNNKWVLPIFIPKKNKNNAYPASLYSHYVYYCIDELKELKNKPMEKVLAVFLKLFGLILKSANIDKCVYINNWLVSTNLYTDLPVSYIKPITEFMAKEYKGYAIAWCSVNEMTTNNYYTEMKKEQFMFLASRSVYIQESFPKTRDVKNDLKLIEDENYYFETVMENKNNVKLYQNIYIDKYSKYNPNFTGKFLTLLGNKKLVKYILVKNKENKAVGVIGYFVRQNILTTPILGYDTSISQTEGLYRRLTIKILLEAQANNYIVHASSGVGKFKVSRGAVRCWEYRAFYLKNINIYRQLVFKLVKVILEKIAKPMMDKRQL